MLEPILDKIINSIKFSADAYNFSEVMSNTRKCIYSRYRKAYLNILNRRLTPNEIKGHLEAFVKYEKWNLEKIQNGKSPRIVQHRSYEFLFVNKAYVLPIVKKLKQCTTIINEQPINTIFMKYYKNFEQINIIQDAWLKYNRPCCLCLDMKAFDGHVTSALLEIEHKFWTSFYTGKDKDNLEYILKHQIYNRGITQNGIYFKKYGSRASGDYTTSDGNSLLNFLMLRSFMGDIKCHIFDCGDDSLIILDQTDLKLVKPLDYFNIFGMECECDRIATVFEDINFCQCNPVKINGTYRFVKDPLRTMSRTTVCPSQYTKCLNRYMSGIGLCELASNVGVPILQAWSLRLLFDSGFDKPLGSVDKQFALFTDLEKIEITNIDFETRLSFQEAFNITIIEQLELEKTILAGNSISNPKLINFINKYKTFHKH